MLGLWVWSRSARESCHSQAIRSQFVRFTVAFALALAATSILKLLFDYPRPAAVYGHLVRAIGAVEVQLAEWSFDLRRFGHRLPLATGWNPSASCAYSVPCSGWLVAHRGRHAFPCGSPGRTVGLGSYALVTSMGLTRICSPYTKV